MSHVSTSTDLSHELTFGAITITRCKSSVSSSVVYVSLYLSQCFPIAMMNVSKLAAAARGTQCWFGRTFQRSLATALSPEDKSAALSKLSEKGSPFLWEEVSEIPRLFCRMISTIVGFLHRYTCVNKQTDARSQRY